MWAGCAKAWRQASDAAIIVRIWKCFPLVKTLAGIGVKVPGGRGHIRTAPVFHSTAMTAILERSFKVLEHLVAHPEGRALSALAADLQMPLSATHRLLAELVRCGYVRQDQSHANYTLTIKL